ncbi:hypothetical protein FRC17_009534 [Serendipita sp. 399]|nr:hypothetical protein FRC17_009534 [Serendipita sp. 399]
MALSRRLQRLWRFATPARLKKLFHRQRPASTGDGSRAEQNTLETSEAKIEPPPPKLSIIESLPVELLLEIIGYLQPAVPLPGGEAAWKRPQQFPNWWSYTTPSELNPPFPRALQAQYLPRDLLALRIVSKRFYDLCHSFLYIEMNLTESLSDIRQNDYPIATKHGKYVRTLRVVIDNIMENVEEIPERQQLILDILKLCPNLTCLALYYGSYLEAQPTELSKRIFGAVDWTNIRSIGVYSLPALAYNWRSTSPSGSLAMLDEILNPLHALSKQIKVFDIAMEFMSMESYNTIRSQFTSLSALTIRRSLRFPNCKIWDFGQQNIWRANKNLTCLQLIDCLNVYSGHIPDLVRFFTSLRTLMISACGDYGDTAPLPRTKGWSKNDDALWRQRSPLDLLYVEHMADWEIVAMGEIPTLTFVAAGLAPKQLQQAFTVDPEIFPCMTTLRMEPEAPALEEPTSTNPDAIVESFASIMETVCTERGIMLKTDAKWLVFNQRQIMVGNI